MVITRCPRCGERVRVPSAAAETRVQCPWCTEQYDLAEALETLPPALVVVEEGPASLATGIGLELDDASDADDEEYFLRDTDGDNASFQAIDTATPGAAVHGGDTPRAAIRARPTRRKRPSAIWMLIQLIGGGVAGVGIALAILWYLDRLPQTEVFSWLNGLKKPAAPQEVQPTLQDLRAGNEADTEFAMPQPAANAFEERTDADDPQLLGDDAERSRGADAEPFFDVIGATEDEGADLDVEGPEGTGGSEGTGTDDGVGEQGDSDASTRREREPSEDLQENGDFAAVRQALDRADEVEDKQSEAARRAFLDVYQQLSAVGATAETGRIDTASMDMLLERVEAIEGLVDALAETAPRWLELGPRRPSSGIVAIGTLATGAAPKLETTWGTEMELALSAGGSDISSAERVIVVGKLLEPETAQESAAATRILVGVIHAIDDER